jgi:IclR family pca regulon transcriptional regulator
MAQPEDNPDFVMTFARGLSVIRSLADRGGPMTLFEVAEAAGLSRPAARRFLLTLVHLGYASGADGRWQLTPRVMELGYSYLSGLSLTEIAYPHLEAMAVQLDQVAAVAILDDTDIVFVARVPSRRLMRLHIDVGTRLPAHSTSVGRVLLAALPPESLEAYLESADLSPRTKRSIHTRSGVLRELNRVRTEGYALVDGELDEDIRGVGIPLRQRGTVIAALNSSFHVRGDEDQALQRRILPCMQATAAAIEHELDMVSPGPPAETRAIR